ncbi:hypothetical protein MSPP1_003807 [Malassezia sp. CBS 17886]|nr:hypothetical protein MSPP1_003807 [Malassezia sp. CBS 17886]
MNASSASQLFQSDASLATGQQRATKAARTAQGAAHGAPIWLGRGADALPGAAAAAADRAPRVDLAALAARAAGADGGLTKVIAGTAGASTVWTAESGRVARHTSLETGETLRLLGPHGGPVSAVAQIAITPSCTLVFTGSWDRSIRVWLTDDAAAERGRRPAPVAVMENAAADLIKCVTVDAVQRILFSGGSDRVVRAWDIRALCDWAADAPQVRAGQRAPTPALLGTMTAHLRPVVCLALVPPAPHGGVADDLGDAGTLLSADSMGRVLQTRLVRAGDGVQINVQRELDGHETSVLDMVPVWRAAGAAGAEPVWVVDVWTASMDCTVRRFALSAHERGALAAGRQSRAGAPQGTDPPLRADVRITLPAPCKAILPLAAVGVEEPLVVLGLTEGILTVWRLSDDGAHGGAVQVGQLEGHWHDITFLGAWRRTAHGADDGSPGDVWVVSAGLDGTVRRWPLSAVLRATHEGGGGARPDGPTSAHPASLLTAKEEEELAELLEE